MYKLLALLFALMFSTFAVPDMNLEPEFNPKLFKGRTKDIIPDQSVYGVSFGSTEEDILEQFGVPNGIIVISESKKALLYGSSHLFILKKGKLRELRLSEHVIDWQVSRQMDEHPFFDTATWVVSPGLRKGMNFSEIREVLSKPNAKPNHQFKLEGDSSITTLNFSSSYGMDGPENYSLHGLTIINYGQ